MRSAIDRYKLQHAYWPGDKKSTGGSCSGGGSAGTGISFPDQALIDQLIYYSDSKGATCTVRDNTYRFGPYLREQRIPPNPLSGSNEVDFINIGKLGLTSGRIDGLGGWRYDGKTG